MKTYVKPAMMALSISANDALCEGCSETTRDKAPAWLYDFFNQNGFGDTNGNGILDGDDAPGLFSVAESCDKQTLENYCKHNPSDSNRVFTS